MLDRNSKISELCNHPYGHDILKETLYFGGKDYKWPQKILGSQRKVSFLDKIIGSDNVDELLKTVNRTKWQKCEYENSAEESVWWKEAVIYNAYCPSFMDSDHDGIGDFGGIARRLPYLESLGINAILLNPFLKTDNFLKSGVLDYYDVMPEFGIMEDFEMLMETAHNKGIRIMASVDITSTSINHPWYKAAMEGNSTFEDYYVFKKGTPNMPPNDWQSINGKIAWEWCETKNAWNLRVYDKEKADLNWANPAVRKEIENVLKFWTKAGIDGFVFPEINFLSKSSFKNGFDLISENTGVKGMDKYSYSENLHVYLKGIRKAVSAELSPKNVPFLGGEIFGVGSSVAKCLTGKKREELDMVFDIRHLHKYSLHYPVRYEFCLDRLKQYYLFWLEDYGNERWMPLLFEDSQTARMVSRLGVLPVYKNLASKLLATLMFTLRGTPVMYQGSELGMLNTKFKGVDELRDENTIQFYEKLKNKTDEKNAFEIAIKESADNARVTMPWNGSENGGFTGADPWIRQIDTYEKSNVSAQINDKASVWNYYRRLINMRQDNKALVYGDFKPLYEKNKNVFCYMREMGKEKWYIEINISGRDIQRPKKITGNMELKISNYLSTSKTLRPYEANVYCYKNSGGDILLNV